MPDEYIYVSLARSLGAHGTASIRGAHAGFPALLEPLVTAPLWSAFSVGVAYPLVKALGALAMASSAIPLYLLSRRAGLDRNAGVLCACFAAVSPNLYFASFVMAN